jgi:hypothetical protein
MKFGTLKFLEPSGPLQACNGTDLPLHFTFLPLFYIPAKQNYAVLFCFIQNFRTK